MTTNLVHQLEGKNEERNTKTFPSFFSLQNSGSFSVVKLGTEKKTKKKVAVKIIKKKGIRVEKLAREIGVMKKVRKKKKFPHNEILRNWFSETHKNSCATPIFWNCMMSTKITMLFTLSCSWQMVENCSTR